MDLSTSRLDAFLPPRVTLQPYLPSNDGTNQLAESANDVLLAARPIPIFQVIRPALRTLDQVIFNLRGGNTHPALDKAPSPATAPMGGRLYLLQGAPCSSAVVAQEPTSRNGLRVLVPSFSIVCGRLGACCARADCDRVGSCTAHAPSPGGHKAQLKIYLVDVFTGKQSKTKRPS